MAYNHGASKAKQYGCCYELREEEARIPYVYHCFKVQDTEYTPYVALELNNTKMDKQLKTGLYHQAFEWTDFLTYLMMST